MEQRETWRWCGMELVVGEVNAQYILCNLWGKYGMKNYTMNYKY